MKKLGFMAICLTAGCTTVSDLRGQAPFISLSSEKSATELAGCFSDAWSQRTGTVNTVNRADGFSMTLTYLVYGSALPAAVIDVSDKGTSREVTVHARKGDAGTKLRSEIQGCV